MKIDVLAFGVHPDDVELSCSGTLLVEKKNGRKKQSNAFKILAHSFGVLGDLINFLKE